jgi:hypothetical protein
MKTATGSGSRNERGGVENHGGGGSHGGAGDEQGTGGNQGAGSHGAAGRTVLSGRVISAARAGAEVISTGAVVGPAPRAGNASFAGAPGATFSAGGVNAAPVSTELAVLCNITEQSWTLHRTHGTFCIAGCAAGEPYTLTAIGARTGAIDLGDKRSLEFPILARDIACDLAREVNSDGGEASYFGVFVCAGSEPSEDELNEAHAQLEHFYRTLVASADRVWERTHNVVLISDLERRAARALHLEKEWSYEPHERVDCPACGEKLRPGVAVCRVCRAVLNREKAAQFGLAASAPETGATAA